MYEDTMQVIRVLYSFFSGRVSASPAPESVAPAPGPGPSYTLKETNWQRTAQEVRTNWGRKAREVQTNWQGRAPEIQTNWGCNIRTFFFPFFLEEALSNTFGYSGSLHPWPTVTR